MSNAFPATTPGRIATDPQYVSGVNPRLAFRLAVDDRSQGPDGAWATRQTVFHDVVVFGRSASTFAGMYRKGDPVLVSGEVRFNNYTTQAGENRTGTQIVAKLVAPDPRLCSVTIDRTPQAERGAGATGPERTATAQAEVEPPPPPSPPADTASRPRWPQQPSTAANEGVGL